MTVDSQTVRTWLHDIANRAMSLGGPITLMRLGKIKADQDQLMAMEQKFEALSDAINSARHQLAANVAKSESQQLLEITCISQCAVDTNDSEFEYILNDIRSESAERNSKWNINGFLLYSDGIFLQRLEGNSEKVRQLAATIALDPRHKCVTFLSQQPISHSDQDRWKSMLFFSAKQEDKLAESLHRLQQLVLDSNDASQRNALLNDLTDMLKDKSA
ncbi:BLUF domain-containing protein [Aestuariibacter salexigens]|uniref:BLUF domain-containing protein n=1 Tax=Aestuariibacter salexigens TaxID=226010 RepID=UPI00040EE517|nr:BLUF domain-containing protein [Aestuariibacter salexigens]